MAVSTDPRGERKRDRGFPLRAVAFENRGLQERGLRLVCRRYIDDRQLCDCGTLAAAGHNECDDLFRGVP